VPDLIAEVLSPGTRAIDRGTRKNLYRRAGVAELWLLDPEPETVEVYRLDEGDYRLVATHAPGEIFHPLRFPSETVAVDELFHTQWKRYGDLFKPRLRDPVPEWLVPEATRFGLEALFLFGHPERRYEIWNNRVPCVLPFGSTREARTRFSHFLEEAAHWEELPAPRPTAVAKDVEQIEVGRFRLTRHGRHVHVDVAVDARKYREMSEVWANDAAWDWGEDPRSPAEEEDDAE
jgi:hypothetical protein